MVKSVLCVVNSGFMWCYVVEIGLMWLKVVLCG